MTPHCLVAPGHVAPTEVTSPQHISCVAPSSKLCRPIDNIWTISAGSGSSSDSSTATGDAAVGDTGRSGDVGEGAVGDTGVGDAVAGAGDGGGESGTATESYSGSDVNSAHAAHSQSISTPLIDR